MGALIQLIRHRSSFLSSRTRLTQILRREPANLEPLKDLSRHLVFLMFHMQRHPLRMQIVNPDNTPSGIIKSNHIGWVYVRSIPLFSLYESSNPFSYLFFLKKNVEPKTVLSWSLTKLLPLREPQAKIDCLGTERLFSFRYLSVYIKSFLF